MIATAFLSGAVTLGFIVASLFFLKFWRDTRDQLFLAFAAAFLLLGMGQAIQTLASIPDEQRSWLFLLRLAAFLIIVLSILRKNREG